jgi:hypothetical protein
LAQKRARRRNQRWLARAKMRQKPVRHACTFAGPRGGGLFAAADRSCHQMLLLKAACQWTAYRGWRRTSYPLMSAKMCPRTYLVCTLPLTRCKQHALASAMSLRELTHHRSRCSVRNAILLKWQTNLTKFLPRAEACQGFKVRWKVLCGLNDFGP